MEEINVTLECAIFFSKKQVLKIKYISLSNVGFFYKGSSKKCNYLQRSVFLQTVKVGLTLIRQKMYNIKYERREVLFILQ